MSDIQILPEGTLLHNRYEIQELLGKGGFGITYRAFDLLLNRYVAIKEFYIARWMKRGGNRKKCVVCNVTKEESRKIDICRESFLREAKIMKKLRNIPYLSRLLDFFSENDTEYIVMKLLNGDSLMSYVKKHGKMSPKKLFPMLEQVLFAMEKMHEKGFIHRDISPNNMLLSKDGDLHLIDFGAATSLDKSSTLWNEQVFNHKGFEAPEHLSIENQGTWTDIYSVCATIVYLLTGEGVPGVDDRIKYDSVPNQLMGTGLSASQQNILLSGLSLDIKKRLASARKLRIELCGEVFKSASEWNVCYEIHLDSLHNKNIVLDKLSLNDSKEFKNSGRLYCDSEEIHIAAICDGNVERHEGELATRAIAQALIHFLEQYRFSERLPERLVDELLDEINEKVITLGKKIGKTAATLSFILWKENHYWTVNIGNSPVYLMHRRKIESLLLPHKSLNSKIKKLAKLYSHNNPSNYLGKEKTAGSQMASISHGHLKKGDTFLLCSKDCSALVLKF